MPAFEKYKEVQAVAKYVHDHLAYEIGPCDTEMTIAEKAVRLLEKQGVKETWYHQCPALVLLGERSCLSISGRKYQPDTSVVGNFNLVTVDLSPLWQKAWGDCARSFFIENGLCSLRPESPEFLEGYRLEHELHAEMKDFVTPEKTFGELYDVMNASISKRGFVNLDFQGNLGHSIEEQLSERRYIESGNGTSLGDVEFFTFEPHVKRAGGSWGYKHENIYFFNREREVEEL